VQALAPQLLGVARRILGPGDADAEDAAQESLIAVVRALRDYRGESSFGYYAKRITVRTCIAVRKRRQSRGRTLSSYGRLAARSDEPAPSDSAASARRRAIVRDLLETLPIEQAETLTLRVVLGMSLAEVAQATGAPVNTVRSRIRLAKEALRKRIEGDTTTAELLPGRTS